MTLSAPDTSTSVHSGEGLDAPVTADVLVAGAGAAGLSAALALAKAGFSVVCVGYTDRRANGRTVALFETSLRFYKSLGLWERFRGKTAPLQRISMIDATGARFKAPSVAFAAAEIGFSAFGENIENNVLVDGLVAAVNETPGIRLVEALLSDIRFEHDAVIAVTDAGQRIEAKLVAAADGRGSLSRAKAGIGARSWTYPQTALTALLSHARPHRNISTEFHTRSGPCTLVPLRPLPDAPHRSSLVWLMSAEDADRRRALDPEALAREVEIQVDHLLGAMAIDGPSGFFPMAGMSVDRLYAHRVALIGEAAHVFPPLAAQGLNLSLRDSAALVEALEDAREQGKDIGERQTLKAYANARKGDISLRTNGVDILNRSLLSDFIPVDVARGAGMFAFLMIGPLRRALMREGILTHGSLPRLMQPRPRRRSLTSGAGAQH
ncbi:FAD-dependent monooxygenase [Methylocapsa palsarum]|uniref:2-octaprenyl-6-methoxyphenol hydroxylase n=1 Tax=Methylocapsa palsarum TaxID=1612308 RepID=A0A1I3XT73_9HYPH|nr:FAD-dependent monooxygenase [Methylocapsa palsarum]SFK22745.1 2-octaprenyl-6-methoxyphenol hydroxylase [Methylocapsa palsarum]